MGRVFLVFLSRAMALILAISLPLSQFCTAIANAQDKLPVFVNSPLPFPSALGKNPISGTPASQAPSAKVQASIKALKGKTLGSYFPPSIADKSSIDAINLSPEGVKKFEKDLNEFLEASGKIGFLKKDEYLKWWNINKARLLTTSQMKEWKDMPLEAFVAMTWFESLVQNAKPEERNKALQKVMDSIDNYWVQALLAAGWAIGTFIITQAWDSVRMAFTNGVVADAVRAYLEPVAKTVRELLAVLGAKHMAPVSVPFSEWGAKRITAAQAKAQTQILTEEATQLADATQKLTAAEQKVAQLKAHLDDISFPGLTVEQMDNNMAKFNKQWVDAVQVWNTALPGNSQGGRNVTIDGVIFRPKDFMRDLGVFEAKLEVYRQGIRDDSGLLFQAKEKLIEKAEKESTEKLQLLAISEASGEEKTRLATKIVEEKNAKIHALQDWIKNVKNDWEKLLTANEILHESEMARKPVPNSEVVALKKKLLDQELPPGIIDDILERQRGMLVSKQQMAAAIAGQMYHDMMFPEFNRLMPKSVNEAFRVMQQNFGFSFFEKKLRPQIHKMLHQMGLEIGEDLAKTQAELVKTTLNAAHARALADPANAAALAAQNAKIIDGTALEIPENLSRPGWCSRAYGLLTGR